MFTRDGSSWRAAVLGFSLIAAPLGGLVATHDPPPSDDRTVAVASAPAAREDRADMAPHVAVTTTTTRPTPTTTTTPPTTTAPPAAPPVPAASPQERALAAYASAVPAAWRAAIPVEIVIIGGSTSWSYPSGRIEVSESHASRGPVVLATTIAHEFGHLIAWRHGTQAFYGAAPSGWPPYSSHPAEAWADCVAYALTGNPEPSHGLPACPGASLEWTRSWLGAGPASHAGTG